MFVMLFFFMTCCEWASPNSNSKRGPFIPDMWSDWSDSRGFMMQRREPAFIKPSWEQSRALLKRERSAILTSDWGNTARSSAFHSWLPKECDIWGSNRRHLWTALAWLTRQCESQTSSALLPGRPRDPIPPPVKTRPPRGGGEGGRRQPSHCSCSSSALTSSMWSPHDQLLKHVLVLQPGGTRSSGTVHVRVTLVFWACLPFGWKRWTAAVGRACFTRIIKRVCVVFF